MFTGVLLTLHSFLFIPKKRLTAYLQTCIQVVNEGYRKLLTTNGHAGSDHGFQLIRRFLPRFPRLESHPFGASPMVSYCFSSTRWFSHGMLAGAVAVAMCLTVGCSQSSQGTTIRGTVTFSGKPLERGTLLFNPTDKTLSATRAEIQQDGSYELVAAPGDYQIIVTAFSSDPPTVAPDHPDYVRPKSVIPTKYNALQTTPLKQTIPPQDTVIDLRL